MECVYSAGGEEDVHGRSTLMTNSRGRPPLAECSTKSLGTAEPAQKDWEGAQSRKPTWRLRAAHGTPHLSKFRVTAGNTTSRAARSDTLIVSPLLSRVGS